ncbi:MAG: serine/threonine-protein kinase [Pseudomonadota bacterium]
MAYTAGLEIGERIGSGHFGQVHRAIDRAHGEVAVKVLGRTPEMTDEQWEVFKANHVGEAQHLSQAEHRHVAKVHYVVDGDGGNSVVICMAFCPGGSLEIPYERGPMPLPDVKRAATQVLHGLGALHRRGMLHRDIKPANILIDAEGVAQLGDFGLVTDDLLLGYGSQVGYSDHIAYEVWHEAGTSARSDIWALGMTLFRLLHGKDWYGEAERPRDVVRHGGFADTLVWLPHIPKDWRRFLRKMLADDTDKRSQNTQQVLNGLAPLTTEPAWQTTVTDKLVSWERTREDRRVKSEWERISARKHRWRAWSEPIGPGRDRTLAGSGGIVGRRDAERGLCEFLTR